ncbi:MAG: hypothetical protein HYU66_11380, partial [Armatimonadetes bacterium]|nr:hypothetical protein [Armatimonadota bacterium]
MTRRWLAVAAVWLGGSAFGGPLRLAPPELSEALTVTGERSHLDVTLENTSERELLGLTLDLALPDGWAAEPVHVQLQALAPFTEQRVRFELTPTWAGQGNGQLEVACPGTEPLSAWFHLTSCPPLAQRMVWERATRPAVDALPEDGCLYVATGAYILFLPRMADGYGAGLIYQRRGADWVRMATLPSLGRVLYEDFDESGKHSRVAEHWVSGQRVWAPLQPTRMDPDGWYLCTLRDQWQDLRGRTWIAKAYFAPTADPRIIKCTHSLWCSGKVQLYRYEGPALCVGDGT